MSDDSPAPRLWTWRRLAAVTLAKAVLAGLLGLAAWGALPAAIGWHPTTVSSGSMLPRLHVGDVAVSRPLGAQVPPLTSVLLFHDPDHPGRLRMHRFVRIDDDGLLVTRGDANPEDDSSPVALSAVVGIGTLRVPWVALPIVWSRDSQWLLLGAVAAGLGLLILVATSSRDRTFDDEDPPDRTDADEPDPGGDPVDVPPEVWSRPGATLQRVVALLGVSLLVATLAVPAGAAFRSTTKTSGSLAATTYFTCANAVTALSPYFYYRMDETSSTATTATDSSGSSRNGLYGANGKSTTRGQACDRDSGRAMTFDGSSGYLSSPAVSGGMPNTFSLSIWFKTTTTTGGKLIGFGSAQTGASGNYDRHLYMSNRGRVYFGVYSNAVKTVSSDSGLNDGAWHLAVATLSSSNGMRLFLDGTLVGSDASVTTGEPGSSAYVRVAYDNIDNWDSTPTSRYFAGTLDDAAYFTSALSSSQVSALYESGTS